MMLHKNTKVKVRSSDVDTDFFHVVVLQGDTLFPYLFIICQDYILQTSTDLIKENSFTLKKRQEADDIPQKLLWTQTTQMTLRFLQIHLPKSNSCYFSPEQAAGGIGLHMNADKMEYMCFNQEGDIFTLNGGSLKWADKFTYLGCSVLSTESNISMHLAKAWTAIESLSIIWKFNQSDKN